MAVHAAGLNVARQRCGNLVAAASATAEAADADTEIAAGRGAEPGADSAGDVEPAIAAAAAKRLDSGAVAVVAARLDVALDGGEYRLAAAAVAAKAADADAEVAVGALRRGDPGSDIESAIAAAAAERLNQQAARAIAGGNDVTADVGRRYGRI